VRRGAGARDGEAAALSRRLLCAVAVGVFGLVVLPACTRKVTEDDCRKVGENVREAWARETKDVKAPEGPNTEKATGIIKSEGEKLASGWAQVCRSKLLGQPASSEEMNCLLGKKTLAELRRCAPSP
jgi:hypothetical protein